MRRILLAVCCVGFTVIGLWMLLAGDPADRGPALVIILFFGVGGGGVLLQSLLTRRGAGGYELRHIRVGGHAEPALVFPYSTGKQWLAGLGLVGFGLAGLGFMVNAATFADGDSSLLIIWITGGFLTLVGLLGGPAIAWSALTRRRYVAATPRALVLQGMRSPHVLAWSHLREIGRFETHTGRGGTHPFLGFQLSDEGKSALEPGPSWRRWLDWLNRSYSGWDLSVPYESFVARGEVVEHALRHLLAHPEDRALAGSRASLRLAEQLTADGGRQDAWASS